MRTASPYLLPLFRSDGQGQLLARVYLSPDRPAPVAQLARELGLDSGNLTREADRLERAGLVRSRRIGNQRLLEPDTDSTYYPDLLSLLLKAFGPAVVIGPAIDEIDGVEQAYLFGSWAARYLGEPGDPPNDVDLLVVGVPNRRTMGATTRALADRLGREVNATIVTPDRWRTAADGFIREVKAGPLLELNLNAGDHG